MRTLRLTLAYLAARPLNAALNVLLLALGIATVTLLLLATHQLEDRLGRDARGIDLVVGAKGSPLQLILAAVFHLDTPTGNIALADAEALARNRMVAAAIPLALGDSFRGYRIVGTRHEYLAHYGARVGAGRLWAKPMEAVIGATLAKETGLALGAKLVGAHGFAEGSDAHEATPYGVVGVLAPTGTVLDRLVLTGVESAWIVHAHRDGHGHDDPEAILAELDAGRGEITALLVRYATPLAAATLPRMVNTATRMQAASPAFESARLFRIVGVGAELLRALAAVFVLAAGLSMFIALYNALAERRYDLAVMRMLGASRARLTRLVLFEGALLGAIGAAIGLALGHLAAEIVGQALAAARQPAVTGLDWRIGELWIAASAVATGFAAAVVPAWQAYRTDVAAILSEG